MRCDFKHTFLIQDSESPTAQKILKTLSEKLSYFDSTDFSHAKECISQHPDPITLFFSLNNTSSFDKAHDISLKNPQSDIYCFFEGLPSSIPDYLRTSMIILDAHLFSDYADNIIQRIKDKTAFFFQRQLNATLNKTEKGIRIGAARLIHDFNTPLSALWNHLELAELRGVTIDSDLKNSLESTCKRMMNFSTNWSDYINNTKSITSNAELNQAFYSVSRLLSNSYHSVTISSSPIYLTKIPDYKANPHINIDHTQSDIETIIYHVMNNACEAALSNDNPEIQVSYTTRENAIDIFIDDNGPGIQKEISTTLWKDFVTTKDETHSGINLGIVRYLLMQRGGSISTSESQLGGACFKISLRNKPHRSLEDLLGF